MTGEQHAKSCLGKSNRKPTLRSSNAYLVLRMSYVIGLFTDVVAVRHRFSQLIEGPRSKYDSELKAYKAERARSDSDKVVSQLRECSDREAALAGFFYMVNGDARNTAIAMGLDVLMFVFSAISNFTDPSGERFVESDMICCASDGKLDGFGVLSGRYVKQDHHAKWFTSSDKRIADLGRTVSREFRKLANFSVTAFFGHPVPEDKKDQAEAYKRHVSGISEMIQSEFGRGFKTAMKPRLEWLEPKVGVAAPVAAVNDAESDEDDAESRGSTGKPAKKKGKVCFKLEMEEEVGTDEPGRVYPLFTEDSSYSTDLNDVV